MRHVHVTYSHVPLDSMRHVAWTACSMWPGDSMRHVHVACSHVPLDSMQHVAWTACACGIQPCSPGQHAACGLDRTACGMCMWHAAMFPWTACGMWPGRVLDRCPTWCALEQQLVGVVSVEALVDREGERGRRGLQLRGPSYHGLWVVGLWFNLPGNPPILFVQSESLAKPSAPYLDLVGKFFY